MSPPSRKPHKAAADDATASAKERYARWLEKRKAAVAPVGAPLLVPLPMQPPPAGPG